MYKVQTPCHYLLKHREVGTLAHKDDAVDLRQTAKSSFLGRRSRADRRTTKAKPQDIHHGDDLRETADFPTLGRGDSAVDLTLYI